MDTTREVNERKLMKPIYFQKKTKKFKGGDIAPNAVIKKLIIHYGVSGNIEEDSATSEDEKVKSRKTQKSILRGTRKRMGKIGKKKIQKAKKISRKKRFQYVLAPRRSDSNDTLNGEFSDKNTTETLSVNQIHSILGIEENAKVTVQNELHLMNRNKYDDVIQKFRGTNIYAMSWEVLSEITGLLISGTGKNDKGKIEAIHSMIPELAKTIYIPLVNLEMFITNYKCRATSFVTKVISSLTMGERKLINFVTGILKHRMKSNGRVVIKELNVSVKLIILNLKIYL